MGLVLFSTWMIALVRAAYAGCSIEAPPDAPFTAAADAPRVQVIVELWIGGGDAEWAGQILDTLESRGLFGVVVVPAGPPSGPIATTLARVNGTSHDVAIALQTSQVPRDRASVKALEPQIDAVRAVAGRVRTVIAPVGARTPEALLGTLGFRSIVDTNAAPTAEPRMAGLFEGQERLNVVLPPGPYQDSCGSDPHVAPFTPPAADRAAGAIARAARTRGTTPVVRIALDGAGGTPTDAVVLGRWLDQVLIPSGASVVTAERARAAVLRGFRNPNPAPVTEDQSGRMVPLNQVELAAQSLAQFPSVLPRKLPGELTPAEAYQAFVLVAASRTEGELVRLETLRGPANDAKSALTDPIEVPASDLRGAAATLAAALPNEIPAAFPVGGRLLTAGELLLGLAGVVRGEDPVRIAPIANPDPNQRGQGWGETSIP